VANEGRFIAIVPPQAAELAAGILRGCTVSADARRIGVVTEAPAGYVTERSAIGATRIVDLLSGEQLPRIC
jgi:hydrogenase expression/formation protein HypE